MAKRAQLPIALRINPVDFEVTLEAFADADPTLLPDVYITIRGQSMKTWVDADQARCISEWFLKLSKVI